MCRLYTFSFYLITINSFFFKLLLTFCLNYFLFLSFIKFFKFFILLNYLCYSLSKIYKFTLSLILIITKNYLNICEGNQVSEENFLEGKKMAEKILGIFTNANKVEIVKMGEEPSGFLENVLQDGIFSRERNDSECYDDLFSGRVLTIDVDCQTDVSTVCKNSPTDDYSGKKEKLEETSRD